MEQNVIYLLSEEDLTSMSSGHVRQMSVKRYTQQEMNDAVTRCHRPMYPRTFFLFDVWYSRACTFRKM